MISDEELNQTRALIMEALATYQPSKSNDLSDRAITKKSGNRPAFDSDDERKREPLNATSTRRKGTSKLNCSEDIFDHLRVSRTIQAMPSHLAKWLVYRYGENPSGQLLPGLVEVIIQELDDKPKQKRSQQKLETMVTKRLMNEREFFDLKVKDLFEAMGVTKQVYFRRYASQNQQLTDRLEALDYQALSELYVLLNTQI